MTEMTDQFDKEAAVSSNRIKRFGHEVWDWAKSLLIALAVVFVIHHFVFYLSTVEGSSMEPTLEDGEWLFVNKVIYYLDKPNRGDIVILKDPRNGVDQYLVKRIIGLPGETVEIMNYTVYINGEPLDEPYTDVHVENGDLPPVTLEEDHYFVMGDNRREHGSMDSRYFGSVPSEYIKGRAEFIIWPVHKAGGL